tara:strand:+ start:851 stop:1054 length:204 start_codon:yes stop_codon:yes gene_type:complete
MHYLLDCKIKIKKTGKKAIVVDHINNHFALSEWDGGRDIINKNDNCLSVNCQHCSDGFFHRNLLEVV